MEVTFKKDIKIENPNKSSLKDRIIAFFKNTDSNFYFFWFKSKDLNYFI